MSVLHEEMTQCYIDESLKKLLAGMVEVSTIPFFRSLEKWIFKGQVFDPCDEVYINIYLFFTLNGYYEKLSFLFLLVYD